MAYEIKYRSEDEMKDSGIEWLGKIPRDWEITDLLKVLRTRITDGPHETPEYVEQGVPFISVDSLNSSENVNLDIVNKYISNEKYREYNRKTNLQKNDILFSKSATIGKVAIVDDRIFMTWSPLAIIKANENKINYKLLYYILMSGRYIEYVKSLSNLNTQLNIGMGVLEKSKIVYTNDLSYQQKIANFLDIKTAEFDSIISKKEQLIEKLEEAKKSLISEVVTGKVKIVDGQLVDRKPEEMKDSGVEWLGMIPKDWEVKRIKYISRLNNKTLSNNEKRGLNIHYIDIGSVDKTGKINEVQELTFAEAPSRARRIVTYEDTIVSTVRTYLKAISYIDEKYDEFICSTGFAVFTPNKDFILPKLFYYMVMSEEYINQIMSNSVGVSYPAINANDITNFHCVLPNFEEQISITSLLEKYLNNLNTIITKTKQQITKLKEAKQSLISEAVTGKIDLRDWEIIEEEV